MLFGYLLAGVMLRLPLVLEDSPKVSLGLAALLCSPLKEEFPQFDMLYRMSKKK